MEIPWGDKIDRANFSRNYSIPCNKILYLKFPEHCYRESPIELSSSASRSWMGIDSARIMGGEQHSVKLGCVIFVIDIGICFRFRVRGRHVGLSGYWCSADNVSTSERGLRGRTGASDQSCRRKAKFLLHHGLPPGGRGKRREGCRGQIRAAVTPLPSPAYAKLSATVTAASQKSPTDRLKLNQNTICQLLQ